MFRARFSIPLALLSTLLTACGGSSRPELRVNENNLCSKFQVQAKAWTPALVKNGLGCLLYDHNQPDSPRYQKLVALPDSAFAQTAVWLNQMLSQEKRGAFFGQLEDFPTEASQLIAIEANRSFAMLPDFARALPFWMATLKLAAINDAQLFRALALTFQNSQRAGTFTLSAGTQDELLRYADWLRSLPASETAANLRAAGTMARAMSPYVDAQKIIGLVATDIPCLKNQTGLAMSSPLLFVYRQILAHQKDPETFFQILGQGLLPWLTTCQADPAFNPTSLAHLMRITNDNFTDISTFINLTLKSDDPLRAARLVGAQAQNLTADGQSPLSLLGSTGALDTLTRIMEATPLATEWLAQLPSLPTLQNLAQHASLDGFAGIAALSPDTIKQLNAATHELNLTPELFLEWQQLIGAFGDGSLPDLADYVQRGQLRSLSATLRKWTGEQSYAPAEMPGVFLPPPTLSPPLPSTNRVNKLISDCLDQNLGIAGTFSCLRQHSSVPGIVYPFFESTSFANFLRRIDGRDPIFAHSRALIDAGWLENPGEYETLFLNALDAVRPFQLPIATFTAQVAQIPNLPSAEHVLIGKYLSELKLPKLSTTRMIQLGHATRSTEDIPGLPNNWKDWLTNEFPVRLMNGLFGLPTTLPTFDRGARVQMQVPLQTFNANGDIVEARYNMNGLEAIDALIWESQIKPFFGTGDRLVMMTIVKDMLALETPADVAAWEERTLGMVDGAIAFLELMIFIPPSDTLLHLRNTRTLLHALHDFVPHEVVLTAAKITGAALPDKTTIDEKTAAFTLLHRIGLFSTLAKWMQTVNPVSKMIPGKPYLSTGAIQTLGTAFSDFLQITPGDAVRRLGWMNEISDGEFFASAMRMFVSSAREERAPSLKWTAKTLATLVVPIFDQIAQGNSTQRTSMQTFFAKIQPVIDQLAKKFSVPSAVLQSTGLFCQARMNDAGGLAGLSQADLVLRLSRPSGRDELVPWIQSGTLRALIEWSAQMNLHPILTPSPQ